MLLSSAATSTPNWQQVDDPLARAREGYIFCALPDHAAKTCEGFVTYIFGDDGSINADAKGALNNDPAMWVAYKGRVELRNREICTTVTQSDIDNVIMFLGDDVFDKKQIKEIEKAVREALALQVADKMICEQHMIDGDHRISKAFIEGIEVPELAGEYAWIEKDAGYSLFTAEPMIEE
jgi:hypothetical protein